MRTIWSWREEPRRRVMSVRKRLSRYFWRRSWRLLQRYAPPEFIAVLKYRQVGLSQKPAVFAHKNLVTAKEAPSGAVLILAPHQDDEVIGPGGALAQHLTNGDPVSVLYLTDGRGPDPDDVSLIAIRRSEAEQVGAQYGLQQIFWQVPNLRLTNDAATVRRLVEVLEAVQPDTVYMTSFFERHSDHFAANSVLAAALEKLPGAPITVLGYEVWDDIPYPNYVVDISAAFATKAAMLDLYLTPMHYTDFVELCRCRNALHYLLLIGSGRRQPAGYAEAFCRLAAGDYAALFREYEAILRENRSPIVSKKHE